MVIFHFWRSWLRKLSTASLGFVLLLSARAETIFIHTGHIQHRSLSPLDINGHFWNRIGTWGRVDDVQLKDQEGYPSALVWTTESRFAFHCSADSSLATEGYPEFVSGAGYLLAPNELIGNQGSFGNAEVIIQGAEPAKLYNFTFYGNRMDGFKGELALYVVIEGKERYSQTLFIPLEEPSDVKMDIPNVIPDADGRLVLQFSVPEGYRRGVLNAITITSSSLTPESKLEKVNTNTK